MDPKDKNKEEQEVKDEEVREKKKKPIYIKEEDGFFDIDNYTNN
jgi:U3 small nucleolar ribonucleoprotein component